MRLLTFFVRFFLFFGIALSPVYIFPSGYPQPADFVLLFFVSTVMVHALSSKKSFFFGVVPKSWLALVGWVLVVCSFWAIIYTLEFYRHGAFWVYNLIVSTGLIYALKNDMKGRHFFQWAICAGLIVSGIGVFMDFGTGVRVDGFFNNPNQLAYYSLCGLSILILLSGFNLQLRPVQVLALLSGIGGVFASASMAAIAGLAFLVVAYVLANLEKFRRFLKMTLALIMVLTLCASVDHYLGGQVASNLEHRIMRLGYKMSGIYEERKYDRMTAFPEYMILGAGEGHLERFYPHDRGEIHSSFGNLLFSYGAPGLILFFALIFSIVRRAPLSVWLVLVAPLVYSITHMGLRSTMFWFLLATIWAQYGLTKKRKVNRPAEIIFSFKSRPIPDEQPKKALYHKNEGAS